MSGAPPDRVSPPRKHLMTPGAPRTNNSEPVSLGRVQRWVLSTLVATTILHLSAGLTVAAVFSERRSAQAGLMVIAAAFGLIAISAALLIHRRGPLSPWLLVGLLPPLVGVFFLP